MIDLHTHVLFGIDDGSPDIENSVDMLREAERVGFKGVVLTPHYMSYTSFVSRVDENRKRMHQLTRRLKEEDVGIKLFLGNELYYEPDLINFVENGEFTTLNSGSHFLVETMRHDSNVEHVQDFLYRLQAKGYATILAHPERYDFIQQDPNLAVDFIQKGTLIQVNVLSLIGFYGSRARETAEIMLNHNMVQFLASDAHRVKSYELLPRALAVAEEMIGAKKLRELMWINPSIVLSGRGTVQTAPQTYSPKSAKKGIFAALLGEKRKKRRKDGIC